MLLACCNVEAEFREYPVLVVAVLSQQHKQTLQIVLTDKGTRLDLADVGCR